ncbi:30S ribosomal protein S13 [Candidatus Saganbacteria bacterium]|nr:30S ribosomal protein S13 [Candidatus Saganbacteria bacterium]
MVRLVGVDLPSEKRLEVALTYLYGIGDVLSRKIIKESGLSPDMKAKELKDDQVLRLREILKDYLVEGDLRKEVTQSIKRLIDIGAYRGARHRKNLPVRGQRTRTNARTKRGARKTIGASKKTEEAKV